MPEVTDGLREKLEAAVEQLRETGAVYAIEDAEIRRIADALLPVVAAELQSHGAGLVEADAELGTTKVIEACMSAVRRDGMVSVVGVYAGNYGFPLGQMFDKGVRMRTGQAPAQVHIDRLLKHVVDGDVTLDDVITHRLPLAEAPHAYDIFNKREDGCVKVVLKP